MPIFKNHRGQFHKMNTALVVLTSLYAIGAVVALSSPYWASSYPVLAPLVAFAATPLGMFMLAAPAIILAGLALYAISKNNKVSEEKAPKLTVTDSNQVVLQVTRDVFEEMQKNNQVENEEGKAVKGKHYIDFSLDGKDHRVIVGDESTEELGDILLFKVDSLNAKDSNGKYTSNSIGEIKKKLNEKGGAWVNTYLGELFSVTSAKQGKGKE